jgi:hypothetical protein
MLDRQKLETILVRRFPGATHDQVAVSPTRSWGSTRSGKSCSATISRRSAAQVNDGAEIRVLRRPAALIHVCRGIRQRGRFFFRQNASDCLGIRFASVPGMSGLTASHALHNRFDAIRRAELERLKKKLAGPERRDRLSVDEITADLVGALARGPRRALAEDSPLIAVEALVRLFALEA